MQRGCTGDARVSVVPAPLSSHCRIDHRKFYEQVRQILKPTGVLAIW